MTTDLQKLLDELQAKLDDGRRITDMEMHQAVKIIREAVTGLTLLADLGNENARHYARQKLQRINAIAAGESDAR